MNSNNCSISQELITTNLQTSTSHGADNNETVNISSPGEIDMATSSTALSEIQQHDIVPSTEMDSCLSPASTFIDENNLSNKELCKKNVVDGNVILDEKQSSLHQEANLSQCESHIKENAVLCNINQAEHTDTSNYNNSEIQRVSVVSTEEPASFGCHGVSDASDPTLSEYHRVCDVSNEEAGSLPKEEQHDSAMDIGQHVDHISEVGVAIGQSQHSSALMSETIKHSQDSVAFIGPVQICQESFSYQDTPLATSSFALREKNVSFTDDSSFNLSVESVPSLVATARSDFQGGCENFLRGCKWSPDGSCVLTNSNDNCLRTFYPFDSTSTTEASNHKHIVARVRMKECGQIYDYTWHPQMSLAQADYGRIACTCSGIPIHLWDVGKGQIVSNYRAYDQFDEITPAYSLAFSLDGSKIYAGYNKTIRIFDTEYPVRSCKTIRTYNAQSKDGQTGIVSCFAFSPDGNGLYVAGSYSRHIGMYDSACDKLVYLMQGQHGGITHLMFSPDATKLYSGGRKDAEILCWDMRNMDKILFSALRDVKTNQRIYFDLSQSGRYLVSGNNDGTVAFWDTMSPVEEINGDSFLRPCSQFQAHDDCVNGVSFNHQHNLVATSSGQRHFRNFDDSSDSAEDEKMEEIEPWDFSLRLWQIPTFV